MINIWTKNDLFHDGPDVIKKSHIFSKNVDIFSKNFDIFSKNVDIFSKKVDILTKLTVKNCKKMTF